MKKYYASILVDWTSDESITKAEREQEKLVNRGYNLATTEKDNTREDAYILNYIKEQ